MDFLYFYKKSWTTDISRKKSWNLAETISSMHNMWLWCLLVCIYKFTIFFLTLSCMYNMMHYNVCLIMVVAVSGGRVYFSKKFIFMESIYLNKY